MHGRVAGAPVVARQAPGAETGEGGTEGVALGRMAGGVEAAMRATCCVSPVYH